jgi:hypothetical protein
MKKLVLNIFALGIFATSFTACEDAQYDVIDNMIYISEAASASAGEIILGKTGEVATGVVTVKAGRVAESDIKVQIGLDNAALASYNNRNDVEFAVIPAEYITLPSEVTIPAGASQVEVPFSVTSFDGEKGVEYAAPIAVMSATDTPVSTGSYAYIITFGKPLVQKAPGFRYNNKMNMVWPKQVDLANFTLEWWVRCTNTSGTGGFSINNQAMFSFAANKELYIRFGDIVYVDQNQTWRNLYNFLQIKTMGIDANYDSGDPNKNPLKWGEWIHFAHTYDAATGDVVLYMNGKEVNRNNGGAGTVFNFTGCSMFGAGSNYHRDVIEMCQLRMWKTTRTPAQIAKNMKKEVKYNDPDLLFYFPMNEGEGEVLTDVTGNGFGLSFGSGYTDGTPRKQAYSWTEYTWE